MRPTPVLSVLQMSIVALLFTSPFTNLLHAAADGNHWGIQTDGGVVIIPNSLSEAVQNRYTASLTGYVYSAGLVRFHANGAPSYSLVYSGTMLDGTAANKISTASYTGNAKINGFMATKYVNFVARPRFSIGLGFGVGLAPQLRASYTTTSQVGTTMVSENKQYVLKELPVAPLFEFQIRGDVRVSRNLSIGPWGGIRNGFPVVGGADRIHFLK